MSKPKQVPRVSLFSDGPTSPADDRPGRIYLASVPVIKRGGAMSTQNVRILKTLECMWGFFDLSFRGVEMTPRTDSKLMLQTEDSAGKQLTQM